MVLDSKVMAVFPKNLESWIFLVVACVVGFLIGQWIQNRRNKSEAERDALIRAVGSRPAKRVSKKERLKARQLLK